MIFGLDKYNGKAEIFKAIDAIKSPLAGSDLGKALALAQRESFNFSTPSTSRILVILTDGRAKDEVEQPAEELAGKGVHVLMVGVGDDLNNEQLEAVASGPKEDSVFDFEMLPKLVERISRGVCEGIGEEKFKIVVIFKQHCKQTHFLDTHSYTRIRDPFSASLFFCCFHTCNFIGSNAGF